MLRRLSSNKDSFSPLTFADGFNVILAERSPDASHKHSRNARGKTTILQIMNYCLGSNLPAALRPLVEEEWEFTLALDLFGAQVSVTRPLRGGSRVRLDFPPSTAAFLLPYVDDAGRTTVDDWKFLLGLGLFGLDAEDEDATYRLSPRTLLSYIIRLEALKDPLKIIPQQPAWSWREHISYLLGLEWRHVRNLSKIEKEVETYKAFEYASSQRLLPGAIGNESDLLLERAQVAREADELERQLTGFQIIDDPDQLLQAADSLTEALRELRNESLLDRRLLDLYRTSLAESDTGGADPDLEALYTEMGEVFTPESLRRLEDVQAFHSKLVANRRVFLSNEITNLERAERERQVEIRRLTEERGRAMAVLQAGGALEELNALHLQHRDVTSRLAEIETALNAVREVSTAQEDARLRRAQARQAASVELNETRQHLDRVSARFDSMMRELYGRSGVLTAEVDDLGYKYSLKVAGVASSGITRMQLLCFDLTLLAESSGWTHHPDFLVHDSAVFDGVDPRQISTALSLANRTVTELGAQYICTMNSSDVPEDIAKQDWFITGVRRTVFDTDTGGILGVSF